MRHAHWYRHVHTLGPLNSGHAHKHILIPHIQASHPGPIPTLPRPSHLPESIPSIRLQKQVSQQPRRGQVSVCPSLCPHPWGPVGFTCPTPHCYDIQDVHMSNSMRLHTDRKTGRRPGLLTSPHTRTQGPRHTQPTLDSLSGCQRQVWDWAVTLTEFCLLLAFKLTKKRNRLKVCSVKGAGRGGAPKGVRTFTLGHRSCRKSPLCNA